MEASRATGLGEAVRPDRISYWMDSAAGRGLPALTTDERVDVAVVGGGIVGLTTALRLAQAGRSVALLEAARVASGVSGYTTAKLTAGHGLLYSHLESAFDEETARRYAESQQAAIELVRRLVSEHGIDCDLEPRANVVYAAGEDDVSALEQEAEAQRRAGLPAELVEDAGLPFPTFAALRLEGQYQFHPRGYLLALADLIEQAGGRIYEQTRITDITGESPYELEAEEGCVRAERVVVATHYPIVEHGFFAPRLHPDREYVVAAPLRDDADLGGMFISASEPIRSLRTAPLSEGGRLLLVGGEKHRVGQESDTEARYAALEEFMRQWFSVGETRYRWSTQDPTSVDRLPYVGEVEEGSRMYVATGFAAWGMSNGTLAGMVLGDAILGSASEWASLYSLERGSLLRSATRLLAANTTLAAHQAGGMVRGGSELQDVAPGTGAIVTLDGDDVAVYRARDGTVQGVSAKCTHMGCTVSWNGAESSWDCPCHGSRFAADGRVLHGPAVKNLAPVELDGSS